MAVPVKKEYGKTGLPSSRRSEMDVYFVEINIHFWWFFLIKKKKKQKFIKKTPT